MQAAISDRISGSLIHFSRGGATSTTQLDLTELYHEITTYCICRARRSNFSRKFIWHHKKVGSDSGFLSRYRATIVRWPEPDAKQGYERLFLA